MSRDPGEPLEKVTANFFSSDMALVRARWPRGGHLIFLKNLLRAWAKEERKERGDE